MYYKPDIKPALFRPKTNFYHNLFQLHCRSTGSDIFDWMKEYNFHITFAFQWGICFANMGNTGTCSHIFIFKKSTKIVDYFLHTG